MKIAILHCRKSSNVCTGASCFKAYNNCSHSFEGYKDNKPELAAFFDCGGCDIDLNNHKGMKEKMERLKSEEVTKIHIGKCVNSKCPHYSEIINMIESFGIEYELGTH